MKFIVNQKKLSQAINIVHKAISTKTTIDILKNIYIKAESNKITLIGNDLSLGIETSLQCEVINNGKFTIDARIFGEIIKKLPDDIIEISVNEKQQMHISCINSEFNLAGISAEEYSELPIVDQDQSFTIDKYLLTDMIRQTIFATSQDESRPILTGSLLKVEDNTMTMVSIDLFRVAMRTIKINSQYDFKVVIPAKSLNELTKIISSETEGDIVTIYVSDKYIKFCIDEIVVVTRLLEGDFIDYEQIIPKNFKTLAKFSKNEIYKAIDRASLIASQGKNSSLLFDIKDDFINIFSNVEVGDVKEKVSVELEGPSLKIGFNPKYWLEMLRVIDEDELQIELTTNVSPCIIKPIGKDNYTYLLLPVRIINN